MLYIISGASRAGKSMIAEQFSAKKNISYFSLDWLVMGFTNGLAEYGIHDLLFPDEIARKSWNFIKAMMESMLYSDVDYILEGEAILPELIIELIEKYPNQLKVCFVGFTKVNIQEKVQDIKDYSTSQKDWLSDKSDEYITDHVQNMIAHSIMIEKSCTTHHLKYFDTSEDFIKTIEKVMNYLASHE